MIALTVNGKPRAIPEPLTLQAFLEVHNVDPRLVAVEYNGEIVKRDRYGAVMLQAGDRLEIVHMVGGGAA
jgi:sulfur carrier protein